MNGCPRCGRTFASSKGLGGHVAKGNRCVLTPQERVEYRRIAYEAQRRARGMKPIPSLFARFSAKVDKSNESGCWPWTGTRTDKGYGQFWVGRKYRPATHIALELDGRPVPAGMFACHHCDNPICVNPTHLFIGTASDNVRDSYAKGRGRWQRKEAAA